jgi:hypothetical protein
MSERKCLDVNPDDELARVACHDWKPGMPGCADVDLRAGLWLYGPATPYVIPQFSENCMHNDFVAIRNRCTYQLPPKDEDAIEELRGFMSRYFDVIFGAQKGKSLVASFEQWVNHIRDGKKCRRMREANEREETGEHTMPFELIAAFTKLEKILKSELYDPRLIQGRNDRYTSVVGRWLWSAGKILADVWGHGPKNDCQYNADPGYKFPQLLYASGLTREDLGAWFDDAYEDMERLGRGEIVVMENDFSRFDSTIGVSMLRLERAVYKRFFRMPDNVMRALRSQEKTKGSTSNGVKYSVTGGRHSGDANTSVGNTIINGVALLHLVCKTLGCKPQDAPMRGVFGGDDSYILMPREVAEIVFAAAPAYFAALGLRPKPKLLTPAKAEFYSSVFVPTAEGTVLLPKPGRSLAKAFYAKEEYGAAKADGWALSNAEALLRETGVFPWMQDILRDVIEQTKHAKRYESVKEKYEKMWKLNCARTHGMTDATWDFLFERYGIDEDIVDDFQKWFALNMRPSECYLAHPLLWMVHEVDVGPIPTGAVEVEVGEVPEG